MECMALCCSLGKRGLLCVGIDRLSTHFGDYTQGVTTSTVHKQQATLYSQHIHFWQRFATLLSSMFYRRPTIASYLVMFFALFMSGRLLAADPIEQMMAPWHGDFSGIRERGVLRALVVPSRTGYFFDGLEPRGLSYDTLVQFEQYLNRRLKTGTLKLDIVFIPVNRDQVIPALENGIGDLAVSNMTITDNRQYRVDFSTPVLKDVQELLVTHSSAGEVSSLSGQRIHIRASSSYFPSLMRANNALVMSGGQPADYVIVDEFLEDEDLLEMVNAGLIPAVIVDSHKAYFWQKILKNLQVQSQVAVREGGQIGWAMRKDSPELMNMVNAFLKKHRKGTMFGNIVFERYLEDTEYVQGALASEELEKLEAVQDYFKTYAKRYDFDWLMLLALAYQESRLEPKARSSSGAVGIMQIKPSTARDKNVNIRDVTKIENNIHAGVKYLRFIRDRYFSDPGMDQLDRVLFTFASYNAGPGRVSRLRKEASRQGLDPNIWFDNVEKVAAQKVGREPVDYVGNILKYWVAYKLALENSTITPQAWELASL